MKILFQGDSITDACRDYADPHHLGGGYPKYAAERLQAQYPAISFEFVNLGISGNQTKDLLDRVETDFVDIQPDVVSIMIGVNDVWHHADDRSWIPNDVFESRYRQVLQAIKDRTNAKIMIIEPCFITVEVKQLLREDLSPKIEIIRKLAREYADVYLPTDGLLHAAMIGKEPTLFAADGVHPTPYGAEYIGGLYAQYVAPLIKE